MRRAWPVNRLGADSSGTLTIFANLLGVETGIRLSKDR
jgi:hypothetical protein